MFTVEQQLEHGNRELLELNHELFQWLDDMANRHYMYWDGAEIPAKIHGVDTMRNEYYVIGVPGSPSLGPFRSRKAAERQVREVQAEMRAKYPDAPESNDFGVYIQHRQF